MESSVRAHDHTVMYPIVIESTVMEPRVIDLTVMESLLRVHRHGAQCHISPSH